MRILATIILLAGALLAGSTATLTGRVTDSVGGVMAKVEVRAVNVETGAKLSAETNDEGLYRILSMAPGVYRMVLEKYGFKTIIKPGVELHVQDIVALNFEMQIGSVTESVTVEGGAPLIQAETAMLGNTMNQNAIAELPSLTRNPYDFVLLAAGAAPAANSFGRGIGVSVNGQRAEAANFLLDGGGNVNPSINGPGQLVPNEAVREYRVLTNSFTAEYGRSAGFIANVVTKSGTNEFHGSIYDFLRNSWLAANTFNGNATRLARPVFNRHQAGGSFGGPIVKDKLFFFGAIESILVRSSAPVTYTTRVPTPQLIALIAPAVQAMFRRYPPPADLSTTEIVMRTIRPFGASGQVTIPAFASATRIGPLDAGAGNPQDTYLWNARIDWNLNQRTVLTGRFSFQDTDQFATVRQPYSPELDQANLTRNQSAALNGTRTWSGTLVSESRLVFNRFNSLQPQTPVGGFFLTNGITGQTTTLPTGQEGLGGPRNLYQYEQTASWIRGNHNFKFGGQLVNVRQNVLGGTANFIGVRANFGTLQGFVDGQLATLSAYIDPQGHAPGELINPPLKAGNLLRHIRSTDYNWFVQDTWKVTRRLTLSPGLRWESFDEGRSAGGEKALDVSYYRGEGSNSYERFANGRVGPVDAAPGKYKGHISLPDHKNFGPRLGLVYDLTGSGKTLFRAGSGVFFNNNDNTAAVLRLDSQATFRNVPFTTSLVANPLAVATGPVALPPVNFTYRDQDFRTAYVASWNATLERELASNFVIGGAYVGSTGNRMVQLTLQNRVDSGRYVGRPGERLVNNYGFLLDQTNAGHSSYHALQLKADRRSIRGMGVQFGAGYTWSHSIDNASAHGAEGNGFNQGTLISADNPRLDRGNSGFDQRHRLVAHFIWQIPIGRGSRGYRKQILSGWEASGIVSFQTGYHFFIDDQGTPDRDFTVGRPNVTGALPQMLGASEMVADATMPNRFLILHTNLIRNNTGCIPNAAPFACLASINDPLDKLLPRNIYTAPGTRYQDVSLMKNFAIGERWKVQFRAELYNLFNHANREIVSGYDLAAPQFVNTAGGQLPGLIGRYGGTPRQVVLALKVMF